MGWFRIFYRVGFIEILRPLSFAQRSFIWVGFDVFLLLH